MSKFGYTGSKPTQSKLGNTGVFNPADITQLNRDNELVNSLFEHVATIEVTSGVSSIEITRDAYPKLWQYRSMPIWLEGVSFSTSDYLRWQVSVDGGSSYDSGGSDYSTYLQVTRASGSQSNLYDATDSGAKMGITGEEVNKTFNLHGHIIGIGESNFESHIVFYSQGTFTDTHLATGWGLGTRNNTLVHNAFRFVTNSGSANISKAKLHLYGMPL